MAYAEKELQEQLLEAGNRLLTAPSSVEELLPLLEQAEAFLSRVEQSPCQTMSSALHPAMKALVAKELLRHSNMDVKVAVVSCISEITRITAPDAPYDDDLMKEIFQMIVEAFEKLDDVSGSSYLKRVSILETVAKVRSCVVMLDLECDDLILEMFHHFLKTIRDNHPENVFSSMETIMTLVLEESEEISSELLSCLLLSVKKDNKDVLPIASRLGENVITKCANKLKPCLMEVVQSMGAPLTDYRKIVASICEEGSDTLEHTDVKASRECLDDDSKVSERTVSDELHQGSVKMETEVGCPDEVGTAADKSTKMDPEVGHPEEVGTAADKLPKSVMSNGTALIGNDSSLVEPTSPSRKTERSRRGTLSKNTVASTRAEQDNLGSLTKIDTTFDHSTKKTSGRKVNQLIQSMDTIDHPRIDSDKEAVKVPNRRKGRTKVSDGSLPEGLSVKESETTMPLEKTELQPPIVSDNETVASPSPNKSLPDSSRPKRGRPAASKMSAKKEAVNAVTDLPASPSGATRASVSKQTENELLPSKDVRSKKQNEGVSDSEAKPPRRSGKKVRAGAENVDDGETPSADTHLKKEVEEKSDSEAKPVRQTGKKARISKGESSGKQQASKARQQKGMFSSEEEGAREQSLKEMVSSPKSAAIADKDQSLSEDSLKTKSRRKRVREEEEISATPHRAQDETLIGSSIKVWWPDDERFYRGIIDSFDPVSKKHKVLYADGDVEVLLLKDEQWETVEGDASADEGEAEDLRSPDSSEKPPRKKGKTQSDSTLKQIKMDKPVKRGTSAGKSRGDGTEDSGKHSGDAAKSAGVRKGRVSKPELKLDDATLTPGSKSKTGGKSKDDTPKTASKPKEDPGSKSKVDTPKIAGISKGEISKPGRKTKDDTPKSGKSKDNTLKIRSKSGDDSLKAGNKSNDDIPKTGSKARDETSKTGMKSKEDSVPTSITNSGSKSKEDAPKYGRKPKGQNTHKTGSKSDANGTSEKGKSGASKTAEGDDSAAKVDISPVKAQDSVAKSGNKRRRKG